MSSERLERRALYRKTGAAAAHATGPGWTADKPQKQPVQALGQLTQGGSRVVSLRRNR